tara:strand:- start:3269 stop:3970 length:702 start_codon:yes stop_codon:yes gene_type:complete
MGGVFTPIFMTDVAGYRRMIEWFPEGLSFDWGSFLGGVTAGVAAFGLFVVQRTADIRDSRKRQKGHLRMICTGAVANLASVRYGRPEMAEDGTLKKRGSGFGGRIAMLEGYLDRWEQLTDRELKASAKYVSTGLGFAQDNLERLWRRLDKITAHPDLPKKALGLLWKIEWHRESMERRIDGLSRDIDKVARSGEALNEVENGKYRKNAELLIQLDKGLGVLEELLKELVQHCK